MTTNDKTKQKLMDSMRKTKAPAAEKSTAPASKATSSTTDDNSQTKNANSINKKTTAKAPRDTSVDHYQSGDRIWPD